VKLKIDVDKSVTTWPRKGLKRQDVLLVQVVTPRSQKINSVSDAGNAWVAEMESIIPTLATTAMMVADPYVYRLSLISMRFYFT